MGGFFHTRPKKPDDPDASWSEVLPNPNTFAICAKVCFCPPPNPNIFAICAGVRLAVIELVETHYRALMKMQLLFMGTLQPVFVPTIFARTAVDFLSEKAKKKGLE